jgi:methionyl-tRNA formyltransferase
MSPASSQSVSIVYVTRQVNRSGYAVLRGLLRHNLKPVAIVLHRRTTPWAVPVIRVVARWIYLVICRYYRCIPLKAMQSEAHLAKVHGIPVIYVESINSDSTIERVAKLEPDMLIMGGGWHERLSEQILEVPRIACINTHPSLLPEFRGTSITRWQVLHGVEMSGVTVHLVESKFDTGPILGREEVNVSGLTPQAMFERLSEVAADLVPLVVKSIVRSSSLSSEEQDLSVGEYFRKWNWEERNLKIDWEQSLRQIHRFVLANTQENYWYRGPTFSFHGREMILRVTRLETGVANPLLPSGTVELVERPDGSVVLRRQGESDQLVLVSVQRGGRFYRVRRSQAAASALRVRGTEVVPQKEFKN